MISPHPVPARPAARPPNRPIGRPLGRLWQGLELTALALPGAIGVIEAGRAVAAVASRPDLATLNRALEGLSWWCLIALVAFTGVRLLALALTQAAPDPASRYQRRVDRLATVALGCAGLLPGDALGDQAERGLLSLLGGLLHSTGGQALVDSAGFVLQLLVTTLVLGLILRLWGVISSRCLRTRA